MCPRFFLFCNPIISFYGLRTCGGSLQQASLRREQQRASPRQREQQAPRSLPRQPERRAPRPLPQPAGAAGSSTFVSTAGAAGSSVFASAAGARFARSFTSEIVHSWSAPLASCQICRIAPISAPIPTVSMHLPPAQEERTRTVPLGFRLHRPHLRGTPTSPTGAAGAVCSTSHHQVDQLAIGTVADTVHTLTHTDKGPLLLRLVLILAKADIPAILYTFHCLDHIPGLGCDRIKAFRLDHRLCNSFHCSFFLPLSGLMRDIQIPHTLALHHF